MIEIVSATRCTACNICVHACPTNVFDIVPGGPPVIARQDTVGFSYSDRPVYEKLGLLREFRG